MILQYFKRKENKFKNQADKIYVNILNKSKKIIKNKFFKEKNFESSFAIISIILIFHLFVFKEYKVDKYIKISDYLIQNFISDLDKTFRDIGIGDMSIGKYVKKYVNKFYYRIKILDDILKKSDKIKLDLYLKSIRGINVDYSKSINLELLDYFKEIKKTTY